jgi:hypothetical protein
MEKKAKAKSAMLKELSKEMSDDMYSPMKDMIGKKGLKKVSVMSDSPEGLKKGLSMAEKLMKLKKDQSPSEDEETESEEQSCSSCKGEGCDMCEEKEESPSDESEESASPELPEMSPSEMEAVYEMLKKKLGK